MSEPFLAEIRIVAFNFAPRGWAFCDGQILPINQNQSLYSLLGTTYGGDGRTSFALPELRGRTPIHVGNGHQQGQKSGQEGVALTSLQMPSHTHTMSATSENAAAASPAGALLARPTSSVGAIYSSAGASLDASLSSAAITNNGANQAHNNMQPYTTLAFCIAIQGLFPSRN